MFPLEQKRRRGGRRRGGLGLWRDAHSDSTMQLWGAGRYIWGFPGQLWEWARCLTTVLAQENRHA